MQPSTLRTPARAAKAPPAPPVAVIADAHLGGPGGSAGLFMEQLEELAAGGCRHLVLLGDLFHVWVADRRYETAEIRQVIDALIELRRRGVRVDYVEGNRDFFVAGSAYAAAFDRVADELSFAAGDLRYLAVHGDGLNDSDRLYRFWRWLSKSPPSRFAMTHLPKRLARWLVERTESGLARTNFKHKSHIPEEVIVSYGARRLAQGHDALILGHFHEERRWQLAGGEIWLLDAWFRSRRVEWLGCPAPVTP